MCGQGPFVLLSPQDILWDMRLVDQFEYRYQSVREVLTTLEQASFESVKSDDINRSHCIFVFHSRCLGLALPLLPLTPRFRSTSLPVWSCLILSCAAC